MPQRPMLDVWTVEYNPCTYESSSRPVSYHWTKRGAFKKLIELRNQQFMDARRSKELSGWPERGTTMVMSWEVYFIQRTKFIIEE